MSNQQPAKKSQKPSASTWVITAVIVVILIIASIFAIHELTKPEPVKPVTTTAQPTDGSGAGDASTPSPTPTPLPSDAASTTPLADAAVGTCFNRQATVDSQGKYIDPIDCTQPHDSEVFYSAAVTDATYPDDAGWQQDVLNDCHPAFKTYTGVTYGGNSWQIYSIHPQEDLWNTGNHTLLCYTTDPLGGRVTSVKVAS